MRSALRGHFRCPFIMLAGAVAAGFAPAPAEAACPPDVPVPITSGTGSHGIPLVFSLRGALGNGGFFILAAGDENRIGSQGWVSLGDLDGDGRIEYRLDMPGTGPGGWGGEGAVGCPGTLAQSYPPLVLYDVQPFEDLDDDGLWDVFEDRDHDGVLDPNEDADGDGRLTPPSRSTPFGRIPGCEGYTREDVDCDGHLDTINEDLNSNGLLDPGEDIDGDRRLDNIAEDRNGNAVVDYFDANRNNRFDAGEPTEDTNLNGRLDGAGGHVEDRNYDGILNDRPAPAVDDEIYLYALDGTRTFLEPFYPYGRSRPLIGGVLLASVAWDGTAYDFDAINTPTRLITLPDGRQFRAVDAAPITALVPHVSAVRLRFGSQAGYRMHIDGLGVDRVDDVGGRRVIFDGYQVALVAEGPFPGEVFLETGSPSAHVGVESGFLTILTGPPFPRPTFLSAMEIFPESAGSNSVVTRPPGTAQPRLQSILDRDRDFITLPYDLCPDVPTLPPFFSLLDTNADGLGDACDPATDAQAQVDARWVTRTDEDGPGARPGAAAAYDAGRGVVVLYGGADDSATWEYDGTTWTRIETSRAPGPRVGHQLVYDGTHRRVLLFGGGPPGFGAQTDLWAYAGGDWGRIETRGAPPPAGIISGSPSHDFGVAWDEAHRLLVLFQSSGQTWILDGSHTWRRLPTPRSPSPRIGFHMAYDPVHRVTVLEGGLRRGAFPFEPDLLPVNDTWEFDGSTWQEVDARGDLAPSYDGAMAYDSTRRRMVNFGGRLFTELPSYGGGASGQRIDYPSAATRLYDGASWSYLPTRPTVPPQVSPAVAYDSVRQVLVVHGVGETPPDSGVAPGITAELHLPEDADGDGVRDAGDNCPTSANPDQADFDHDGFGDLCDTCPETDNPTQRDLDRDGDGDGCDPDIDGDGVANGEDACPAVYVAGRPLAEILDGGGPDSDADGRPDDCDLCPRDPRDDTDADGVCGETDNCPAAFNPHQEDSTPDGSGDACQPVLVLEGVFEDGGDELEVFAFARDPNGDPLAGSIEFLPMHEFALQAANLDDPVSICSSDTYPQGNPGKGIVFVVFPDGPPVLWDVDTIVSCEDGQPDYVIAPSPCHAAGGLFEAFVFVSAPPQSICLAPFYPPDPSSPPLDSRVDLTVTGADATMVRITRSDPTLALRIPFDNGLPERSLLSGLVPGGFYGLIIEVSDGSSPPVRAEIDFLYQGEQVLVIPRLAPIAVVRAAPSVECEGPEGGLVRLDGQDSTEGAPGSGPLAFAWYEDLGLPTQRLLAAGPSVFSVVLPLGLHDLALQVTDADGLMDTARVVVAVRDTAPPMVNCPQPLTLECTGPDGTSAPLDVAASDTCSTSVRIEVVRSPGGNPDAPYPLGTTSILVTAADGSGNLAHCATSVTVRDTRPPALTLVADPRVLWPPNHRLVPVQVAWAAQDTCDAMPAVRLVATASSEPDDAEGEGDGRTSGDIAGAEDGTPDAEVSLRAERAAAGPGRAYELVYAATDASGNSASALTEVTVPHDQGSGPEPLLMRVESIGVSGLVSLSWTAVPGAETYDLLAGDVSMLRVVDSVLSLGPVRVLTRGIGQTYWSEGEDDFVPAPGRAVFYVAQYRDAQGAKGYGTASGPWPRAPGFCEGGCP